MLAEHAAYNKASLAKIPLAGDALGKSFPCLAATRC